MSEVFKQIFEEITDQLPLPVDAMTSFILSLVIGKIAFRGAYADVGALYRGGWISGSWIGSLLHWVFRLGRHIVLWAGTYCLIVAGRFVYEHWVTILSVLVVTAVVAGLFPIAQLIYREKHYVGRYLRK